MIAQVYLVTFSRIIFFNPSKRTTHYTTSGHSYRLSRETCGIISIRFTTPVCCCENRFTRERICSVILHEKVKRQGERPPSATQPTNKHTHTSEIKYKTQDLDCVMILISKKKNLTVYFNLQLHSQ